MKYRLFWHPQLWRRLVWVVTFFILEARDDYKSTIRSGQTSVNTSWNTHMRPVMQLCIIFLGLLIFSTFQILISLYHRHYSPDVFFLPHRFKASYCRSQNFLRRNTNLRALRRNCETRYRVLWRKFTGFIFHAFARWFSEMRFTHYHGLFFGGTTICFIKGPVSGD